METAARGPRIRPGTPEDAVAIADLAHRTFRETYAEQTDPADMDAFLAGAYDPGDLENQLRNPRHRFFVVEDGARAAGFAHAILDESNPSVGGSRPSLLAEIYLERSQQGRGTGAALMQQVIDAARKAGSDVLWLGVWEKNDRAIGFYRRWGFDVAGDMPFEFGSDRQRDLVMALALSPGQTQG